MNAVANKGLVLEDCLPTCIETEMALLGRLLLTNSTYSKISSTLKAEHFAQEAHQIIYGAIGELIRLGKTADPITLKPYLVDDPGSEKQIMEYMIKLLDRPVVTQSVPGYVAEIIEYHARRQIVRQCFAQIKSAATPQFGVGLMDLLNEHDGRIQALRPEMGGKKTGFIPMSQLARETTQRIQGEWNGDIKRNTMSTGFPSLDEMTGGLEATDVIVIAGRPASGKTSLGVDMLVNTAQEIFEEQQEGVVAAFSIEMSDSQLVERILSRMSRVPGTQIRRRKIDKYDMQSIWEATASLEKFGIEIDADSSPSIADIMARARDLHRKKRLRLLLIDYLQLIKPFKENARRDIEITNIVQSVKQLAKELGCPIILLSQVKREVDDRPNKIPKASDVAEGGGTEQVCDAMLTIHRRETYLIQDKPDPASDKFFAWEKEMRACKGVADVFGAKTRHGAQNVLRMGYDGPRTTFLDKPEPREPEPAEAKDQAQRINLSQGGKDLKALILSLSIAEGTRPTAAQKEFDRSLHAGARLVKRETIKEEWAAKVRPDLTDERELKASIKSASDNLRNNGLTSFFRDKDKTDYIYLVDAIAN